MPTYENECENCQYVFETHQNIKDNKLPKCPKCEGKSKRIISSKMGLKFNGAGFYENDYKKKTGNKEN